MRTLNNLIFANLLTIFLWNCSTTNKKDKQETYIAKKVPYREKTVQVNTQKVYNGDFALYWITRFDLCQLFRRLCRNSHFTV